MSVSARVCDRAVTAVAPIAYIDWIRRFVIFHGRKHPRLMGEAEVATFLTDLAVVQKVSASTQNQALHALLFLYRHVSRCEASRDFVRRSCLRGRFRRPRRIGAGSMCFLHPAHMLSGTIQELLGHSDVRTTMMMRSSASILEAAPASFFVPREPLIANASTDAVPSAQLRHSEPVAQRVLNELNSFFHRCSLQPGHRQSSLNRELPCSLEGVLPMFPDRSVTDVPGLYRRAA